MDNSFKVSTFLQKDSKLKKIVEKYTPVNIFLFIVRSNFYKEIWIVVLGRLKLLSNWRLECSKVIILKHKRDAR